MIQKGSYEFDAIGTHWWIERLDDEAMNSHIQEALVAAADLFEKRYSRFRDDSLLAELARSGTLTDVPVEMIRMLEFSKQLFSETHGAFNITVGGTLHALGYGSRKYSARVLSDPWRVITWHGQQISSQIGLMLDFGGFGKGWLIETFADILRSNGVRYFLINGGGDMYIDAPEPVELALEDPLDSSKAIGQTRITKGALAASSTQKRAWEYKGEHHHHIIDPSTEHSSKTDVLASFVRADSALLADTIATIVMIRPELVPVFEKRYNAQIILVQRDPA